MFGQRRGTQDSWTSCNRLQIREVRRWRLWRSPAWALGAAPILAGTPATYGTRKLVARPTRLVSDENNRVNWLPQVFNRFAENSRTEAVRLLNHTVSLQKG